MGTTVVDHDLTRLAVEAVVEAEGLVGGIVTLALDMG